MATKETALGQGTIAYHGESPEYWAEKTRRLPGGRTKVSIGLALVGLLLVMYAGSPLAPTPVSWVVTDSISVNAADQDSTAVVVYAQGASSHRATVKLDGIVHANQSVALLVHPGGAVSEGDQTSTQTIWVAGLLLLLVAGGRALWRWRRRGERITFS